MTRWLRIMAITTIALITAIACGNDDSSNTTDEPGSGSAPGTSLSVITTTSIIGALTEAVAGDAANVQTLMEPGVDPHLYEFTSDDARAVSNADLVLMNGIGLDDHLLPQIESANGDVPVVTVTDGIELLEAGDHDHDESAEDHDGDFDPHVWQDPIRVKQMVENIGEVLAEHDPENQETYTANADAYRQELDETHQQIRQLIEEIPRDRRTVVTNHAAFNYFAERYGLEIAGTVIPGLSTESDPSAQQIAELAELIEQENVRAILVEEAADPRVAEELARDTGVEFISGLYTEQVGDPGTPAETVHGMLLANAREINAVLAD